MSDPLPTEAQREALCRLMYEAFVEIRSLCWTGRAEQAADLADAFHNLPFEIYNQSSWSRERARAMLETYCHVYTGSYDYPTQFDAVFAAEDPTP